MKRQAENFHVVVGMTRLIKMPSYWFGDVLAVVFHIQKMFAETISQPSSCFADVKLVTGGAPYAIDDIAESAVEMIGDLGGVQCTEQRLIFKIGTLSPASDFIVQARRMIGRQGPSFSESPCKPEQR